MTGIHQSSHMSLLPLAFTTFVSFKQLAGHICPLRHLSAEHPNAEIFGAAVGGWKAPLDAIEVVRTKSHCLKLCWRRDIAKPWPFSLHHCIFVAVYIASYRAWQHLMASIDSKFLCLPSWVSTESTVFTQLDGTCFLWATTATATSNWLAGTLENPPNSPQTYDAETTIDYFRSEKYANRSLLLVT